MKKIIKKVIVLFFITIVLTVSVKVINASASEVSYGNDYITQQQNAGLYSKGNGTPSNPYQISNSNDLRDFLYSQNPAHQSANYVFLSSIDARGISTMGKPRFDGVLIGNSVTISNLTITIASNNSGFIHENYGTIQNLKFENTNIVQNNFDCTNFGFIVGKNFGNILSVSISTTIFNGKFQSHDTFGGMVGFNQGTILNSTANLTFHNSHIVILSNKFQSAIGGMTGFNQGSIQDSKVSLLFHSNSHIVSPNIGGVSGININRTTNTPCTLIIQNSTLYIDNIGGTSGINFGEINNSVSIFEINNSELYINYSTLNIGGTVGINYRDVIKTYSKIVIDTITTAEANIGGTNGISMIDGNQPSRIIESNGNVVLTNVKYGRLSIGGITGDIKSDINGEVTVQKSEGNVIIERCEFSERLDVGGVVAKISINYAVCNLFASTGIVEIRDSKISLKSNINLGGIIGSISNPSRCTLNDVDGVVKTINTIFQSNSTINIGGIVGFNELSTITINNSYGTVNILFSNEFLSNAEINIGGILGFNFASSQPFGPNIHNSNGILKISNVDFKDNLNINLGGIVGDSGSTKISFCKGIADFENVNITGRNCKIGGITGNNNSTDLVIESEGTVELIDLIFGDMNVNIGGIAGINNGKITNSKGTFIYRNLTIVDATLGGITAINSGEIDQSNSHIDGQNIMAPRNHYITYGGLVGVIQGQQKLTNSTSHGFITIEDERLLGRDFDVIYGGRFQHAGIVENNHSTIMLP